MGACGGVDGGWRHKRGETPDAAAAGDAYRRRMARQTYLVEHYRPGLAVEGLRQWAARVRDAALAMERDGKSVRYVRSMIVPGDESLLCLLEAATEQLVHELYARAGIPFERIQPAIADAGGTETS
jgi:hypothetical protein